MRSYQRFFNRIRGLHKILSSYESKLAPPSLDILYSKRVEADPVTWCYRIPNNQVYVDPDDLVT